MDAGIPFSQDALPDVLGASVEEFNFKSVISEPPQMPESQAPWPWTLTRYCSTLILQQQTLNPQLSTYS
jgi:hypothetical protein